MSYIQQQKDRRQKEIQQQHDDFLRNVENAIIYAVQGCIRDYVDGKGPNCISGYLGAYWRSDEDAPYDEPSSYITEDGWWTGLKNKRNLTCPSIFFDITELELIEVVQRAQDILGSEEYGLAHVSVQLVKEAFRIKLMSFGKEPKYAFEITLQIE